MLIPLQIGKQLIFDYYLMDKLAAKFIGLQKEFHNEEKVFKNSSN